MRRRATVLFTGPFLALPGSPPEAAFPAFGGPPTAGRYPCGTGAAPAREKRTDVLRTSAEDAPGTRREALRVPPVDERDGADFGFENRRVFFKTTSYDSRSGNEIQGILLSGQSAAHPAETVRHPL